MSHHDLPPAAAQILNRIRKDYAVAFNPMRVHDRELQILQIENLEPLLAGQDPFKEISSFPFWVKVWESSMVLANFFSSQPAPKPGQHLLELGAGLGVPGFFAALQGYQVTLSDFDPLILDFQRVTAAANGLDTMEFRIIDWTKPPVLAPFDTIIGAEILFRDDFFAPLLALFEKMLAPGGQIFLAHDARRKSLPIFMALAQEKWNIAGKPVKITSGEESLTIILNRLTLKQGS